MLTGPFPIRFRPLILKETTLIKISVVLLAHCQTQRFLVPSHPQPLCRLFDWLPCHWTLWEKNADLPWSWRRLSQSLPAETPKVLGRPYLFCLCNFNFFSFWLMLHLHPSMTKLYQLQAPANPDWPLFVWKIVSTPMDSVIIYELCLLTHTLLKWALGSFLVCFLYHYVPWGRSLSHQNAQLRGQHPISLPHNQRSSSWICLICWCYA